LLLALLIQFLAVQCCTGLQMEQMAKNCSLNLATIIIKLYSLPLIVKQP